MLPPSSENSIASYSSALSICHGGVLSVGMRGVVRLFPSNAPPLGVIHHELQRAAATRLNFAIMSSRPTSAHAGVSSTAAAPVAASKAAAAVPESGGGSEENSFFERKMAFRKQIKLQLKAMSQSAVDTASSAVAARLLASSQLAEDTSSSGGSSGGGAVSIYLAMPGELNTQAIVSELFKRGKKVYIPKVRSQALLIGAHAQLHLVIVSDDSSRNTRISSMTLREQCHGGAMLLVYTCRSIT